MKTIQVKKGQVVQRKGDVNPKVYNVSAGLLRSYSIDEKGKEHIFMFAPEGWIMADAAFDGAPAELFIDALEDSTLLVIERDTRIPNIEVKPLLKRISVLQKRVIMLLSSSARVRYEHFMEAYPNIIQRVPQKMIATYLGITPEALSRVRKEVAEGNKHV